MTESFRHSRDHISHRLQPEPPLIKWSREILGPFQVESGPSGEIRVSHLSDTGQAAVRLLDAEVMRLAVGLAEALIQRKTAWEADT
jgi:hypothetical protein